MFPFFLQYLDVHLLIKAKTTQTFSSKTTKTLVFLQYLDVHLPIKAKTTITQGP
jgi:beta-galactosidase beta subunit